MARAHYLYYLCNYLFNKAAFELWVVEQCGLQSLRQVVAGSFRKDVQTSGLDLGK